MALVRTSCQTSLCQTLAPAGAKAWAAELFETARFPDRRLDRRAQQIAAAFAAKPCDSIPQTFNTGSGAKAAYRFIENGRVTCEAIRAPLADAAGRACASCAQVLAIQDSTALTFPKTRHMQGLGALNDHAQGMMFHTTLAVRRDGEPLGVLHLEWWARKAKTNGKTRPNTRVHPQRRPLELTLVEVWERNPPQGVEPLHWLLWSTETIESLEDALEIVEIYRLRWRIEDYHLVLKAGCRAEDLQFETAVRQAVLWIGRLGGHLGRKRDGMPGLATLWRGWRDLENLVVIYCATTS